jgi:calcium-dependent protein kinase
LYPDSCSRETKEICAIKTIRKSKIHRLEVLRREIEILRKMRHPNIIRLLDVYEDER